MPLPLLRIPYVALRYVTNHMSEIELVKISLCSRKADRTLKRCGQKELSYFNIDEYSLNNLEHLELSLMEAGRAEGGVSTARHVNLCVGFRDSIEITVTYGRSYIYSFKIECLNKMDQFAGIQKSLTLKDTFIPVVLTEDKKIHTFFNSRDDGLIILLRCFNEKFRYVTHSLDVSSYVMPDALESLRKFIHYFPLGEVFLSSVSIQSGVHMSTKDFKCIMENVRLNDQSVSRFSSQFKTDQNFKFHSTISCSEIRIYSGYWITLDYLLECKHKKIEVMGSKFTREDIKIYINQWVAGTIPDVLEVYVAMSEPFEVEYILSGLQRCRVSDRLQRDTSSDYLNVFVKGAGDKVAMIKKLKWRSFTMDVYSDPDAVCVKDGEE
ncbi:unnamed protein product [Caenorhabditis brenneri]